MFRKTAVILVVLSVLAMALAGCAYGEDWQSAYRNFITSGEYKQFIRAADPIFTEVVYERDTDGDRFALYDIDQNGIPELLVHLDYGIEQADVFTFENGKVAWKGTIGGDNFFQAILGYEKAGRPGAIYTLMGGPAMQIEEYRLVQAGLVKRIMGYTGVDSDGMTTSEITMTEDDPVLAHLVSATVEGKNDQGTYPDWYSQDKLSELFGN